MQKSGGTQLEFASRPVGQRPGRGTHFPLDHPFHATTEGWHPNLAKCVPFLCFQESVVRLASILRDASHLLTNDTSFSFPQMSGNGGVSTQLGHSLHVVLKLVDCPFLFATPLFVSFFDIHSWPNFKTFKLRSSDLLTSQKFALFEIREHFGMG